jgi:hypothetical protein
MFYGCSKPKATQSKERTKQGSKMKTTGSSTKDQLKRDNILGMDTVHKRERTRTVPRRKPKLVQHIVRVRLWRVRPNLMV